MSDKPPRDWNAIIVMISGLIVVAVLGAALVIDAWKK